MPMKIMYKSQYNVKYDFVKKSDQGRLGLV